MLFTTDATHSYIDISGEFVVPTFSLDQTVQLSVISTSPTTFSPQVVQIVSVSVLNTSSSIFDPIVAQDAQITQLQIVSTSSTIFDLQTIQIAQLQVLSVPSIIFSPAVEHIVQLSIINITSSIFDPAISYIVQLSIIAIPRAIFDHSVISILQIITMEVLSSPSIVYNPSISGEGQTPMVGSIADRARAAMLAELSLSEPQLLSATDLVRQVLATSGQTLITQTDATTGEHYNRYLIVVRDV